MKKRSRLVVVAAICLACILLSLGSAKALEFSKHRVFRVQVSGPVSVLLTSPTLVLNVTVTNSSPLFDPFGDPTPPHQLANLQAIVIDPLSGARILGPQTLAIDPAEGLLDTGASITKQLSLSIPVRTNRNKSLAVIIFAVDDASVVQGSAGWGFVTN